MKPWQCEMEWRRGRDSSYYENLARHFEFFALRDDDMGKAEVAASLYSDATAMRRYELKLRQAGQPKPQRKHPPQSRANKRGELTARQLEIWHTICDEFQSPALDFAWLGYTGGGQLYIRSDAKVSDAVLQALERRRLIEITGVCPNGTLFRIAHPELLPPRRKQTTTVDPTW